MPEEENIFANLTGDSDPTGKFAKLEAKVAILEKERNADGTQKYPSVRHIHDTLRPTQADLDRKFTTDELIELCMKRKCCVRMDKFNPVEDYAERFRAEGRLQNRSQQHINKLLTKAIMKHKSVALYTQDEIDNSRKYHWMNRKRSNYLDLCRWKHERELKKKRPDTSKHITGDSDISDDEEIIGFVQPVNNDITELELNSNSQTVDDADFEALCFNEVDDSDNFEIEDSSSMNVKEQELNHLPQLKVASFAKASEDFGLNSEIMECMDHINTDSLYPDSEYPLSLPVQSEPSQPLLQSEPLPYEAFNTQIPLTSTQSQNESQSQ